MRKTSYIALGAQETFIVPLLAREISQAISGIAHELYIDKCSTGGVALDCGCGNQPFRDLVLKQGFQYESLDLSQNSFNNVDYLCALDCPTDEFISVIDKRYSLVLATEVLEHISNWDAAFANIASVIEPGGYALLTAPFFYPLHEEPHDFCRPTVHQFAKYSSSVGLEVHSIEKVGNAVDVIGTVLGATRITYALDGKSSLFTKIINRFLLKSQKTVFKLLVKYRHRLDSGCESIYLSNVVILKKILP